ncbi:hypothetical protein WJX72_003123 [[Myrmecia] bisecta]|uniref:Uncharacterized protein n=1 Tax=[Myrmecia] bisecta TaxID=41462 RepID=A0AAW1QA74_9CHLO
MPSAAGTEPWNREASGQRLAVPGLGGQIEGGWLGGSEYLWLIPRPIRRNVTELFRDQKRESGSRTHFFDQPCQWELGSTPVPSDSLAPRALSLGWKAQCLVKSSGKTCRISASGQLNASASFSLGHGDAHRRLSGFNSDQHHLQRSVSPDTPLDLVAQRSVSECDSVISSGAPSPWTAPQAVNLASAFDKVSSDGCVVEGQDVAQIARELCLASSSASAAALGRLWRLSQQGTMTSRIREEAGEALPRLARFVGSSYPSGVRIQAAQTLANLTADDATNREVLGRLGAVEALVGALNAASKSSSLHEPAVHALSNLLCDSPPNQAAFRIAKGLELMMCYFHAAPSAGHALSDQIRWGRTAQLRSHRLGADARVQEHALWVVTFATQGDASSQAAICDAGVVPDIVLLLQSGTEGLKAAAAAALCSLADGNLDNQHRLREAGALEGLAGVVASEPAASLAVERSVWALVELVAGNIDNQEQVAMLGGIPPLVVLLDSPEASPTTVLGAAGALCNLADGNPPNQEAMRAVHAVPKLCRLLGQSIAERGLLAEVVAWCLQHLTHQSTATQNEIRECGGIPVLLQVLEFGAAHGATEKATWAVCNLAAENAANRDAIREAGGIPPLVRLLAGGPHMFSTAAAAWALQQLAVENPANQAAICAADGVGALVELLGAGPEHEIVVEGASGALLNLATDSRANQEAMREAGAIPALLSVAQNDPDCLITINAAGALRNLASRNVANQDAMREAGGVRVLGELLAAGADAQATAIATEAILNLAAGNEQNKVAVRATGGLQQLVELLSAGPWMNITERVLWTLTELMTSCEGNQNKVRDLGGVDKLMDLLKAGPNQPVTQHAARALQAFMHRNQANQDAVREAGGAEALVKLLDGGAVSNGALAATWALKAFCSRNAANQDAVQRHQGIAKIIQLLGAGPHMPITTAAVFATSALAESHAANKDVICESGGLEALLKLLETSAQPLISRGILAALAHLAEGDPPIQATIAAHKGNQDRIREEGGIPSLLAVAASPSSSTCETQDSTSHSAAIVEAGALPLLVRLLQGTSETTTDCVLRALQTLARHHRPVQDLVRDEGAIPTIVSLLASTSRAADPSATEARGNAEASREEAAEPLATAAAWALVVLAFENPTNRAAIRDAGGLPPLINLLYAGTSTLAVEGAVLALLNLCHDTPANQEAVREAGGIAPLVALLRAGLAAERAGLAVAESAAACVRNLAAGNRLNQDAICEAGGVDR